MSDRAKSIPAPWFTPIRMIETEISGAFADIEPSVGPAGRPYTRAWSLVRLHSEPLGSVALDMPGGRLDATAHAQAIWHALHVEINAHLRADGLPLLTTLDPGGVSTNATPRCIAERESLLAAPPFISVIIATRERPESLAACLRAFERVSYPQYEIIVVDNAPATEATRDLILGNFEANPCIRYAREEHPGLGWAHNCGLRYARGEIVAFTDDDVIVDVHWLSELLRGFAAEAMVGCVTGLVVPKEIETSAQFWFEQHSGFNKGFRQRIFDLGAHRPGDRLFPYRASMFGTGANMAFRAGALRAVGGFDPVLGPGTPAKNCEDLDAYFRVIQAGYTLVYQPSALVRHVHRTDYSALREQYFTYGVGLTAYLTKCIAANPLDGFRLLSLLPAGLAFARSTHRRSSRLGDYSPELTRLERRGRLYGPFAYLRSRWKYRRATRRDIVPDRADLSLTA